MAAPPVVRVVVVNFDGGQMTLDCLDSLLATDWPSERLEIVLVDNGSLDNVAELVRARYPGVRLLEPFANLGFAGGCNLGIRQPGDHDYVALVNNDAVVTPGWLRPLVRAAEAAPDIGAVSPKLLFADRYQEVVLDVPEASTLSRRDGRVFGVRLSGVRLDGVRDDARLAFDERFHCAEPPHPADAEEIARWSSRHGSLRVIVRQDAPVPAMISLRLACPVERRVILRSDTAQRTVLVGPEPTWFDLPLGGEPFDVVNNAGSNLYRHGFGGDRGYLERDRGQYDEPVEVFAWCGGAVLLKRAYLDAVGLFDERLFLYYEDTDLAWRGRLRGWRYMYEPTSIVRHRHAASSGLGSPTFRFHTERNRLLVLAKNAPARLALRESLGEVRRFARTVGRDVLARPVTLRMPVRAEAAHRWRVLRSYVAHLPSVLRDRWQPGRTVRRRDVMRWEVVK